MGINLPLLLQGGFFAALLGAASARDIKKRIIPDSICLSVALTGLLIFEPIRLFGILADRFDSGDIIIKNKSTKDFKAKDWDSYRNTYLGFVFAPPKIKRQFSAGLNEANFLVR